MNVVFAASPPGADRGLPHFTCFSFPEQDGVAVETRGDPREAVVLREKV